MTRVIDKDEAIALVKKYAEAEPDKEVPCHYVEQHYDFASKTESPTACCIVGNILINDLGYDIQELLNNGNRFSIDTRPGVKPNHEKFRESFGKDDVKFTDEAINVFDAAQSVQDNRVGSAWEIVGVKFFGDDHVDRDNLPEYRNTWGDAYRFVKDHFASETQAQN